MSWKNAIERRRFLAGLGLGTAAAGALPFLESVLGRKLAHAQPGKKLTRLVIVSQSHMSLGYHRIPEFCTGAWGAADPSLLRTDMALGLRIGAFGTDPGKLGGFYAQGALGKSPRLQKEMMVVNGLGAAYDLAQGHLSDANGSWKAGNQGGKFNPRARYPLSGAVHQPMVTIDQVIAKKIHGPSQRSMFMGSSNWGGGGADTNESIDASGAIQGLTGSPRDVYNSAVFDAGRKVTAAQQKIAGGAMRPAEPPPVSTEELAAQVGLEWSQEERKRLLADKTLSAADRKTLEQYYDLLKEGLEDAKGGGGTGATGQTVSASCAPPTLEGGGIGGFLKLVGSAFLCDLSRVAYISVGTYQDHNTRWHAGADGNAGNLPIFNALALQVAQVAEFLTTLTDPMTGRDMLETTLVLGITNNSMALKTDGRDTSHEFGDYSYFSVGGSAALRTGNMYDALGVTNGKRTVVNGPIPTVNQYLQTIAAAFGLTAADWSPAGGKGFGPWLGTAWRGRPLRVDEAARTSPIPGLLVG